MTDTRKDLRVMLPANALPDFEAAKLRAEAELGITMTANEFARRVLVQAVKPRQDIESFAFSLTDGNPHDRLAYLYGLKRRDGETDDELFDRVQESKE